MGTNNIQMDPMRSKKHVNNYIDNLMHTMILKPTQFFRI